MTVADNTPNDPGSKMTAVRAIAIVCGFSYDSAYDLLKANGRKCSRGIRLPVQPDPFRCIYGAWQLTVRTRPLS
jgi:hypothetical protein